MMDFHLYVLCELELSVLFIVGSWVSLSLSLCYLRFRSVSFIKFGMMGFLFNILCENLRIWHVGFSFVSLLSAFLMFG